MIRTSLDTCCFFTNLRAAAHMTRAPRQLAQRTLQKEGTAQAICPNHQHRTIHKVPRGSQPSDAARRRPHHYGRRPHLNDMMIRCQRKASPTSISGDFSSCRLCKQSPPFEYNCNTFQVPPVSTGDTESASHRHILQAKCCARRPSPAGRVYAFPGQFFRRIVFFQVTGASSE